MPTCFCVSCGAGIKLKLRRLRVATVVLCGTSQRVRVLSYSAIVNESPCVQINLAWYVVADVYCDDSWAIPFTAAAAAANTSYKFRGRHPGFGETSAQLGICPETSEIRGYFG